MVGFAGDVQLAPPLEVGDEISDSTWFSPFVSRLSVLVAWFCYRRGYNSIIWGVTFYLLCLR